jgi:hypothetical protein
MVQAIRPSEAKYAMNFGAVWQLVLEKTLVRDSRLFFAMKRFPENYSHPGSMKGMAIQSIPLWCEEMMTSSPEDIETENTVNP